MRVFVLSLYCGMFATTLTYIRPTIVSFPLLPHQKYVSRTLSTTSKSRTSQVPVVNPILTQSLTQVSARLAKGTTNSSELVNASLNQINRVRRLNAFVSVSDMDSVVQRAYESDQRWQSNKALSPLDGIPIAVKDNFCTDGQVTTAGSKMLDTFNSPYTATVVQRLEAAGAIVIGKTNLDEFSMGSYCINGIAGPSINPLSPHITEFIDTDDSKDEKSNEHRVHVAGGSSGGSATAVASFCSFGAVGSDTGGSVRLPAAYCGLVGLKPTYGALSRFGLIAYASSFDTPAVFGRDPSDTALMMRAMAGHDAQHDSTSVACPSTFVEQLDEYLKASSTSSNNTLNGITIGIPEEFHIEELSDDVLAVWRDTVERAKQLGAQIARVSLPSTKYALPTYYILASAEASSNLSRYDGIRYGKSVVSSDAAQGSSGKSMIDVSLPEMISMNRTAGFGPEVQRRIMLGSFVLSSESYSSYVGKAQQLRRVIHQEYRDIFRQHGIDALLFPTSTGPAPTLAAAKDTTKRDPVDVYLGDIMTVPANLAGLPALSIPVGAASDLPVGMQLLGDEFTEPSLLRVADALLQSSTKS
jgi:aspartyl-tRNA(Asn)/glutamyl-tRNA(Gln) amidotransferase subunit A